MTVDEIDKLVDDPVITWDITDNQERIVFYSERERKFYQVDKITHLLRDTQYTHWYYVDNPVEVRPKAITSVVWEEVNQ